MATKMAIITIEQAKAVATLQRPQGRLHLAETLGWDLFSEEDDLRKSILLDFYYDSFMFTVQKGMPWTQICAIFKLTKEVQEEAIGKTLPEAIRRYQNRTNQYVSTVSEANLKTFTEYFFATFMTHFKLFQYVFTRDQDKSFRNYTLNVETAIEPQPFSTGKPAALWDYEQKVKCVEEAEEKTNCDREMKKKEAAEEAGQQVEESYQGLGSLDRPLDRQNLIKVIEEITRAHVTAATHHVTSAIEETMDNLDFKLQKTSIPRPPELGPPTRYRLKTPLNAGKRQKSPQREKSSKSRSSNKSAKK